MQSMRPLLFLSLLSLGTLCQAQQLFIGSRYVTADSHPELTDSRNADVQDSTGPIFLDHTEEFLYGESTFAGRARASVDYGRIGLNASTRLDNRRDAAEASYTEVQGSFMDPLTISAGSLGDTIKVTFRLHGLVDFVPSRAGFNYNALASFRVYDEVEGWVDAEGQTFEFQDLTAPHGEGHNIDYQATVTLRDYDPSRRYALDGSALIGAQIFSSDGAFDQEALLVVDALNTATVTSIGFVGSNGLYGSFVGSTGFRYSNNPVPEPASLLAFGAGLALVRRRARVR